MIKTRHRLSVCLLFDASESVCCVCLRRDCVPLTEINRAVIPAVRSQARLGRKPGAFNPSGRGAPPPWSARPTGTRHRETSAGDE